jgi:hypothetical protein
MTNQEVQTDSAEERLKKRAEASDVEVFAGDAPDRAEEIVPGLEEAPESEEDFEQASTISTTSGEPEVDAPEEPKSLDEMPEGFVAPPIINDYTEVYHYMRTVGMTSNPQFGILAGPELDAEVNSILKGGYDIIDVLAAGYSPEGDRILFIFGKATDGEPKFTEMHFVKRVLGLGEGAITGFNADVWINYQIEVEGYRVYKTLLNGAPPEGVVLLWILVR